MTSVDLGYSEGTAADGRSRTLGGKVQLLEHDGVQKDFPSLPGGRSLLITMCPLLVARLLRKPARSIQSSIPNRKSQEVRRMVGYRGLDSSLKLEPSVEP
jgi:hypothetical protein